MLRNMTTRAGIVPYLTNHSMRATTITVLSSNNIETRKIKAVTGHRPTLNQFKDMSSALSTFVDGKDIEQPQLALTGPYPDSRLAISAPASSCNALIPSSSTSQC